MNNFITRLFLSIVLIPIILTVIYLGNWFFKILLLVLVAMGLYEIFIMRNYWVKIIISLLFFIFVYTFYHIRISNNGFYHILICLLITWLSDTGGYIFGKIIGGKKINFISPNKTYAGFFGALLLPQTLAWLLFNANFFSDKNINYYFVFIFFISISAIVGDLFFSYLKRKMNIKDYSKLIPGHGGLFDRIDSLIFVVISFYFFIKL